MEIMKDPVMDNQGTNYEKSAIYNWLERGNTTSPSTGQPLTKDELRPNIMLKQVIENWLKSNPE